MASKPNEASLVIVIKCDVLEPIPGFPDKPILDFLTAIEVIAPYFVKNFDVDIHRNVDVLYAVEATDAMVQDIANAITGRKGTTHDRN